MSICARRVRTCPLRGPCVGAFCVHLCTAGSCVCPLRGPCIGASCMHSRAAGSRLLSPSVPPPAALAACWKRSRSVREISPLWKEFFLKFTSGNQDKPVQSSAMEPGVSARRGAASAPLFPYFSIDIAPRACIFLFRLFHGRNRLAFYG